MSKKSVKAELKNTEPWSASQIFLAACLAISLSIGLFIAATKLAEYIEEKSDAARSGSVSGCSNIDKENLHARSIFCPQNQTGAARSTTPARTTNRQDPAPTTSISGSSVSPSTPSRKPEPSFYGQ